MKKTALITGGSGGIGLEIARIHAQKGGDLILTARSKDKLDNIKKEFENRFNIKTDIIIKDLALPNASKELFDEVKSGKMKVDYLINNAGFGYFGKFTDTDWTKELNMINLNITALVHLTKLFLKDMLTSGSGKIMNVSSIAGFQPGPLMSVYYASKSFVLSFSEAIAEELDGTDVTVTTLSPGPTETDFQKNAELEKSNLFKRLSAEDPKFVAEYGYQAMLEGKRIAIPGIMNKITAQSSRFVPRKLVTKAVKMIQQESKPV
jgi:short-subunit dehydrogenase